MLYRSYKSCSGAPVDPVNTELWNLTFFVNAVGPLKSSSANTIFEIKKCSRIIHQTLHLTFQISFRVVIVAQIEYAYIH
jgi:hypothetical protein